MFNSTILDVAIGLVFCFASVALFVSAINEAIASALKLRHKTLLEGMKQLLNDPNASGLVLKLYNHALINPLSTPALRTATGTVQLTLPSVLPAYIPSWDFASALIDVIQGAPGDFASISSAVRSIRDPQLKQLMLGFLARAGGSADRLHQQIADWFDNAMDRLSGVYKRRAQVFTFVLGFVVALAFNIDSFYVLSQLWARPALASAVSGATSAAMIAAAASSPIVLSASAPSPASRDSSLPEGAFPVGQWMSTLRTLPVGWDNGRRWPAFSAQSAWIYATFVVGLLVTASSAVFGAPFWFDLLQRMIQVRGTGSKPAEASSRDKPAGVA
jgi:hypothetical protein